MKKYILHENIALRSWQLVPYAYYIKNERSAKGLKQDEYELLKLCDGNNEIPDSELLQTLLEQGLIRPAKIGETLSSWQRPMQCDNRYFPAMNLMITGRCNYNCLHCFNASNNNRIKDEFTLEEALKLIKEAKECGINAFTITGGEPMLHPHFMDIVRAIYDHGMYVEELNTNGVFLTQDVLDAMKTIGCYPLIKISFDGIGWHDWLRGCKGAEEDALRAIELCVQNGFRVKAQTNVHRKNVSSMLETAIRLNNMGTEEMRIVRTTESPRWAQNAGDSCLTFEEYFDAMLEFITEYVKTNCKMEIDIWQFVHISNAHRVYRPEAILCGMGEYRDSLPVCKGNRGMVAVSANGNLYPCHQQSGLYDVHGWHLGNVKEDGLKKHLQEGAYLENVCRTVKNLAEHNSKCASCQWFKYCCGGCRVIALAKTDDVFGIDPSSCLYFEGGYMHKLESTLEGYTNLLPILQT